MVDPIVLVPAHLDSKRLPRKALALIGGVPMAVRCAQQAMCAGLTTYICSNSIEIQAASQDWGIPFIETPVFSNGTDRCAWAAKFLSSESFILLQGDEPLISASEIRLFSDILAKSTMDESTIFNGLSILAPKKAADPNNVKASLNAKGELVFLSRHPITSEISHHIRYPDREQSDQRAGQHCCIGHLKQLGLYGFSSSSLRSFSEIGECKLEESERIEMLRWIVNSRVLRGVILNTPAISVDTPTDLTEANIWLDSCMQTTQPMS